jgi:hypothetical protein
MEVQETTRKIVCFKTQTRLNTVLKFGLFAAAIGLLVWEVGKNAIANFSVEVKAYGKPSIKNTVLTVPLQLQFNNPTPVPISIDRFLADIFVWKNDQYVKAATVNQSLTIPVGKSDSTIFPTIQLDTLFGGDILSTLKFASTLLSTKQVNIRIDYFPIVAGVTLPVQRFTQTLPLS